MSEDMLKDIIVDWEVNVAYDDIYMLHIKRITFKYF
jgi:hypothetical protein